MWIREYPTLYVYIIWLTIMKYAIEVQYNKLIEANDNIARYVQYVCPKCRKEVHFVSSVDKDNYQRIPHFAHNKGEGSIECENYCPPTKGNRVQHFGGQKNNTPVIRRRKKPNAHLEIEISEFYWSLRAVIHVKESRGKISIEHGYQGPIEESVEEKTIIKRSLAPQTNYIIEFSDRSPMSLSGLSDNQINIFSVKNNRLEQNNKPLHWGEKYYVVWNEELKIDIPKTILGKEFFAFNKWKCTEIFFPDLKQSIRSSLEQWVSDNLNKTMDSLPDQEGVSLIFPPENCFSDHHSLLIGIYRDNAKKPIQGKISFVYNGHTIESPPIDHASPLYIDTQMVNQSLASMTFNNTKYIFHKSDTPNKNLNYPSVFLMTDRVRIEANDWKTTIENIDSHSLKEIILPAKMPVHIIIDKKEARFHQFGIKPQKTEDLDHFKIRLLEKIAESLKRANSSLELDFNNYGRITLLKQKIKDRIPLSNDIKRQVQWLTTMTWHPRWNRKKIPDSITELKEFLEAQKQRIKPEMEPYFRSMIKKINYLEEK